MTTCIECGQLIDPDLDRPYCLDCLIVLMAHLDDLDAEYINDHRERWVAL